MSDWRRFSYSISIAVLLTALAWLFYPGLGELLAVPGILLNGLFNLGLELLYQVFSEEEYAPFVDVWVIFGTIFYTYISYLVLWVFTTDEKVSEGRSIRQSDV